MTATQTIRIALLLVVIFAAGVFTGRLTVTPPPAIAVTANGPVPRSPDYVFTRLKEQLHLSPEQEKQARPLLEESLREISQIPRGAPARLEQFKQWVPRMRALLRPDQMTDFERYVSETEKRFERAIRNRNRKANTSPPEQAE